MFKRNKVMRDVAKKIKENISPKNCNQQKKVHQWKSRK